MLARPDPATFQILPERDGGAGRLGADVLRHPRCRTARRPGPIRATCCAGRCRKAAERGFTFYTHPEIEFFLLKNRPTDGSEPLPIDNGGYFDMTSHDTAHDFRRAAVDGAGGARASRSSSATTRSRPGQQEIDLRYADALSMADNIMTFRHVIKEVAIAHGAHATFMPKPFRHQPGSGMHTHLSLFEGDRNAFHDPTDELNLSKTARAFIAGLLRARPRDHRGHQPVGELLQAAVRLRRARVSSSRRRPTSAGATRTARRSCGCRCTSRARPTRPGSRCARSTRPATRTSPSR